MKAIRLHAPMDLRIDEIETPKCGPGEVLIKTECCGLCGSDRPRVLNGEVPFFPNTLGHEFSATVVEIGEGVTTVKPGDLVVALPLLVCHQCENCKNGNFGECTTRKFIGLRVMDVGGFAQYNVLPEINVLKVPSNLDRIKAVFVEPTSVAIHSILRVGFKPGKDVAIIGAGTIGQLIIQSIRAMGAKRIYVFDINDDQLGVAKQVGADFCYNITKPDFKEQYFKDTEGFGCPYVFEAVGFQDTILLAMDVAKVNANIALVGNLGKPFELSAKYTRLLLENELNLMGIWLSFDLNFPGDAWRLAVHYISTGKVDVNHMIYKIEESKNALDMFKEWQIPGKVTGKIILDFKDL